MALVRKSGELPTAAPALRELYRDAYISVLLDEGQKLLRFTRSAQPFPDLEAPHRTYEVVIPLAEPFARAGFNGATMAAIADEAGLPKANLHYYFATKEDLYREVVEKIFNDWLRAADSYPSPAYGATSAAEPKPTSNGSTKIFAPEGVTLPLSSAEFRLLTAFAERAHRVLSREQLLELGEAHAWACGATHARTIWRACLAQRSSPPSATSSGSMKWRCTCVTALLAVRR